MRIIIFFAITILLLPCVVIAGEIFNDEITDNEIFYINGVEHIVRYYPAAKKVSMKAGDDRVLIEVLKCEDIGSYKYCVDRASVKFNDETGETANEIELRVLESGPEIEIDRGISTDEPNINSEVDITAQITNEGNERAININYEDSFPSSVKVSSAHYNTINNKVLWVISLDPGESQSITYSVKFTDFITYNSTSKATVIFGGSVKKYESDEIYFDVQKPYELSDSVSSRSVAKGEDIEYTVSINNTDPSVALEIRKIEITLPEGVSVSSKDSNTDYKNGKIFHSGSLEPGESRSLTVKFRSDNEVRDAVSTEVNLRSGTTLFDEVLSEDVNLGVSDILPLIIFAPSNITSGRELEIDARIVNDGNSNVSSISIDMASNIIDTKGWRNIVLEPGEDHIAFNKIITAPAVDEITSFFVKLSGSYTTASGEKMKFDDKKEVTVLPGEKLIEITPVITVDGNKVNITLNVKNIAGYVLEHVSLIDGLPKGYQTATGERFADIEKLAKDEELTVYSYIVETPNSKLFDITHTFNMLDSEGNNVLIEKVSSISLSAEDNSATEDGTVQEQQSTLTDNTTDDTGNTTSNESKEPETKKKGIFSRMIGWFKGLFS
ncbi:DUF11 domain-containing protein [Candidatus Woesearchaeota archaeon]|nr:DUF11 domain-containing protein [Candidatus Woesearchaeota archaeon]